MTSLRDTTADAAAELGALRAPAGGSVTLEAEQAREARRAICDALSTLAAVERNARNPHDRFVIGQRRAGLQHVLTLLGPETEASGQ
jgi:hypothetical protein